MTAKVAQSLAIGAESAPRFEFRTFGQNFDLAHRRMARLSVPLPENVWERHSDEIYIVSRASDVHNTKIRNGKLDIKTYVQTVESLEQWKPLLKAECPFAASVLSHSLFPAFGVEPPLDLRDAYGEDEFLELVRAQPGLQLVRVHKQRFGYMVHDTICEYAVVLINGARVVTMNSESTDVDAIRQTVHDIGLGGVENINYLRGIKRVIGMHYAPLANE